MTNKDTLMVLNELIQTSEDGRNGFAEATEEAARAELRTLFHVRSIDCGAATVELQRLAHSVDNADYDRSGEKNPHGWIKLQSRCADGDIAMLDDVSRAEDIANAAYERALTTELSPPIRNVVQRQYDCALRNHELIRGLRSSYQAMRNGFTSPHIC